jgi:large subunit ribosomal protein L5
MAKAKQMQRLEKLYKEKISLELHKEFGYKSIMQVPKITKIVVNMGVGDAVQDTKRLDNAAAELTQITGQKPLITKAKKSLAAFKLREGMPIGAKVTLRGKRMYDFLDKLVSVIFPEIDYDKVQKVRGMDITIVNTAKERKEAFSLLQKLGMPFEK